MVIVCATWPHGLRNIGLFSDVINKGDKMPKKKSLKASVNSAIKRANINQQKCFFKHSSQPHSSCETNNLSSHTQNKNNCSLPATSELSLKKKDIYIDIHLNNIFFKSLNIIVFEKSNHLQENYFLVLVFQNDQQTVHLDDTGITHFWPQVYADVSRGGTPVSRRQGMDP